MGTDIGAVAPTDKRDESQFLLGASHCNVSAGGPSPSWTCALLILLVMVKEEAEGVYEVVLEKSGHMGLLKGERVFLTTP